jgi:hypothetical protein
MGACHPESRCSAWLASVNGCVIPNEGLDEFADRARAGAREAGQRLLVLGGLPKTQAQQDVAMAAYDRWLASDDGVPPEESPLGARPHALRLF